MASIAGNVSALSAATALNPDGSAVISLTGSDVAQQLRFTSSEVVNIRASLTPPSSIPFEPGMNTGTEPEDFLCLAREGVKFVRVEIKAVDIFTAPPTTLSRASLVVAASTIIEEFAAQGIRVQLLVGAHGSMVSPEHMAALGDIAKRFGPHSGFRLPIRRIELMNETSMGYQYNDGHESASYKLRARTYAERAKEGALAMLPYGVGAIVQAEDGGSGSSVWVDEMFSAVPDLASHAGGWVIHAYPSQGKPGVVDTGGAPKLERMIADLAAHGDHTIPIEITEWGFCSNNGEVLNNGQHFTWAEAAVMAKEHLAEIKGICGPRLRSFMVYQVRDQAPSVPASADHERYFGVLGHEGQPKGAYTEAIEHILAS
jgi:hypothetical protein